jgi:lysine biosynthesis protein LysW
LKLILPYMHLICPECKNEVDLSNYPNLETGHVVECDRCGITLEITDMDGEKITAEVVDEGK